MEGERDVLGADGVSVAEAARWSRALRQRLACTLATFLAEFQEQCPIGAAMAAVQAFYIDTFRRLHALMDISPEERDVIIADVMGHLRAPEDPRSSSCARRPEGIDRRRSVRPDETALIRQACSPARFLTISGPGVAHDAEFCPNCHVTLEERAGNKVCRLCHYETRKSTCQRRIRVRRR
jgi:hypothetical protein